MKCDYCQQENNASDDFCTHCGMPLGQWYYLENGQEQGPLSSSDVLTLYCKGQLTTETILYREQHARQTFEQSVLYGYAQKWHILEDDATYTQEEIQALQLDENTNVFVEGMQESLPYNQTILFEKPVLEVPSVDWFYQKDEQWMGPVQADSLLTLYLQNEIVEDTLVRNGQQEAVSYASSSIYPQTLEWYIDQGKKEDAGPFSTEQAVAFYVQQEMEPDTLVWAEGLEEWIAFEESALMRFLPEEMPVEQMVQPSTKQPFNKWKVAIIALSVLLVTAIGVDVYLWRVKANHMAQVEVSEEQLESDINDLQDEIDSAKEDLETSQKNNKQNKKDLETVQKKPKKSKKRHRC